MLVIGLCGGTGSGKGAVCELLKSYDFLTIDTDAVYHTLITEKTDCFFELVSEFGESILTDDKRAIDRKRLSAIVFSSSEKLSRLNAITHFHILNEVRAAIRRASEEGRTAAVVDAPLLFESGFDKECNYVICVVADKEMRIRRIVARDSITEQQALSRIDSQLSDEFLIANSDFTVPNNGDLNELRRKVEEIVNKIKNNI